MQRVNDYVRPQTQPYNRLVDFSPGTLRSSQHPLFEQGSTSRMSGRAQVSHSPQSQPQSQRTSTALVHYTSTSHTLHVECALSTAGRAATLTVTVPGVCSVLRSICPAFELFAEQAADLVRAGVFLAAGQPGLGA